MAYTYEKRFWAKTARLLSIFDEMFFDNPSNLFYYK